VLFHDIVIKFIRTQNVKLNVIMNMNCKVKGTGKEVLWTILRYYPRVLLKNLVKTHILQAKMTPKYILEILKLPYMLIHEMYKISAFNDK
jgi:hypothetical protein